tara:strand:- start:188 stop:484 length:297 start_codon:yes stop_codon:yes gene_type:complete
MAIYKSFTGAGQVLLISQNSSIGGSISKILLCNTHSTSDLTITVYFEDSNTVPNVFEIIKNVVIPPGASLVLEDNLSFNASLFSLKATHIGDFDAIIS